MGLFYKGVTLLAAIFFGQCFLLSSHFKQKIHMQLFRLFFHWVCNNWSLLQTPQGKSGTALLLYVFPLMYHLSFTYCKALYSNVMLRAKAQLMLLQLLGACWGKGGLVLWGGKIAETFFMASSQRTCTLACNSNGANGRHLPCSHFQACLQLVCCPRATPLWFPLYTMLPLGVFFVKPLLAFPAWEIASLTIRLQWYWRGQCGKLDCSLFVFLPHPFPQNFSILCGITHFIWLHMKCFILQALFYVLVFQVHFCGPELSTKQTLHKAKVFFSEYTSTLWDVQNLAKHSTLCLNCFSALLTPLLKRLCLTSPSWPRKAHECAGSRCWEPNTRVWVFNWEALRVVLFLKNKRSTGTKMPWLHF